MTVADRFQTLLLQIDVPQREIDDYAGHYWSVSRAVVDEYPGSECSRIGSHVRGSAIGGQSDLDLLARLPVDSVRRSTDNTLISSGTVLENVRQRLLYRFPYTAIGRDGQAIVVNFASGQRDIDVVPAVWCGMIDVAPLSAKRPAFLIPDGFGGWMRTSPQAHNDYIASADARAAGKLTRIAKLLRYWRRCRTPVVPMLTFHAELVLAQESACVGARSYASILADTFALLADRGGRGLQDPLQISGIIPIASTDPKRDQLAFALRHAADRAAKAVCFENCGQISAAYDQWSLVFNGAFPTR